MARRPSVSDPRPPAQAPRTAKREIGCSELSAASSANAFSLCRGSTGVLSRVTDAASSQRLLAAGAPGERAEADFRRAAPATAGRHTDGRWPTDDRVPHAIELAPLKPNPE